ncbi:MAG: acyl-CoA dehydrogenase family protein [Syntrophotaleaceae bacterium]
MVEKNRDHLGVEMEFALTEEQIDLRDAVIRFAQQEIDHDLARYDKDGDFLESWRKCADMQIMALPFPEEYGGCGADFMTTVVVMQALGYACRDAGLVHAIATQILCGLQIHLFGSIEQKQSFLPPLCRGEKIFSGHNRTRCRIRCHRSHAFTS